VITVALEGIENMLKTALTTNHLDHVVKLMYECNGVTAIEDLQNHQNKSIYDRAVKVSDINIL
jgi:hypothetical protein